MAPILASSQSKSKLRAFEFSGGKRQSGGGTNVESTDLEKENIDIRCDEGKAVAAQLGLRPQSLSQRSIANDARECPQTPVGRLALAELIASGEVSTHQSLHLTPTERVLWDQSPHNSAFASSVAPRKGKKRAHSSSPASSSQNETSNHFAANETSLDLQTLQKCLKTPQADPANDLWSRYSVTNERQSPTTRVGPPFAHLLNSSSPQTPASHLRIKESGGLRRSVSCTTEWPTSFSKRRKLEHNRSHEEVDVAFAATEGENTGRSKSKRSRVSLLVDRLHDELAGSRGGGGRDSVGPSSSSPLPEKGDFSHVAKSAETRSSQTDGYDVSTPCHARRGDEAKPPQQLPRSQEGTAGLEDGKLDAESLSDFGDDDLDLEMLKAIDADMADEASTTTRESIRRLEATMSRSFESHDTTSSSQTVDLQPAGRRQALKYTNSIQTRPSQKTIESRDDEFDDDDNDVSAADLEDAVARYDLEPQAHIVQRFQPSLREGTPSKPLGISAVTTTRDIATESHPGDGETDIVDLSSDDEFGGALDFDQVIAECAEVTQAPPVASQPQSSVCIKHFGQPI